MNPLLTIPVCFDYLNIMIVTLFKVSHVTIFLLWIVFIFDLDHIWFLPVIDRLWKFNLNRLMMTMVISLFFLYSSFVLIRFGYADFVFVFASLSVS